MADLKIKLLADVPVTLQHRAVIAVGTDVKYDLYIGKTDNTPILLTRIIGSLDVVSIDNLDSPYDLTVIADNTIALVDAATADVTVNLPAVGDLDAIIFTIKRIDVATANNVNIETAGAETIDGAVNHVLAGQYDSVMLVSDGANWYIIGQV